MAMDNGFADWGGYMNAKISKLEKQFSEDSHIFRKSNLFAGISIFVNGLTSPNADELKQIMMEHGGTFHHYQRSHTTYVIASNLPDTKVRNMNTSKIISPQWVVDCVKENRILDYTKYLLYTNRKTSQPRINFTKKSEEKKDESWKMNESRKDPELSNILRELRELKKEIKKASNGESNSTHQKTESTDETTSRMSPELFCDEDIGTPEKIDLPQAQSKNPNVAEAIKAPTVAKSAVDPQFLSEFYNNSRLHHISTLGAGFKQYVSDLREKHDGKFPARNILREKLPKVENATRKTDSAAVMHIDMDCFFVSVGLCSHPELRGQPVAVTHSKGSGAMATARPGVDRQLEMNLYMKRISDKFHDNIVNDKASKVKNGFDGTDSLSEIASCSYEARKMGVKNGMFVGQALKLCPQLKTIPYDFEGYREVAYTLYNTIAQYTLNIEAVSCDEMFVDLTDLLNDVQVDTMSFVKFVRDEVRSKTGCPCSAGVGGNRLQARMATKKAKPDGQYLLNPGNVEEYMKDISISDLPGVGWSTANSLTQIGCRTCGDLQKIPLIKLQNEIGKKFGETLYQFCRGIDIRPLTYGQIRKSVSAEVNYGIRFTEYAELETFLRQLCTEVHTRLTNIKRKGKSISLKLMIRAKDAPIETAKYMGHGFCDHLTKSVSLPDFTDNLEVITKNILSIMKSLSIPPKELRGIGIQITKLDTPNQEVTRKENDIKILFNKAMQKTSTNCNAGGEERPKITSSSLKGDSIPKESTSKTSFPTSTAKRSPGKNSKNRGRPPKQKDKNLKTHNIADMFQKISKPQKPSTEEDIEIEGIDPTVLAELPEEIRQEVVNDYTRLKKMEKSKNKTLQNAKKTKTSDVSNSRIEIDAEFLNVLPPTLRKEVEKEISHQDDKIVVVKRDSTSPSKPKTSSKSNDCTEVEENDNISSDNIFIRKNFEELVKAWIKSSNAPENYDVQILRKHAADMILENNMYDLYDQLVFLKSCIENSGFCEWHNAYRNIMEEVHSTMKSIYGGRLMIDDKIVCDKC